MFLKLTHRRAYAGAAESPVVAPEVAANEYESPTMARVLERIARSGGADVLDLGVVTGESVSAFAEAGATVHVHDIITPWLAQCHARALDDDADVEADPCELLGRVGAGLEQMDVVCVWELFDLLPQRQAEAVLARVAEWVRPKGWILAAFNVDTVERVHRFRVSGDGRVVLDDALPLVAPRPVATNNQVTSLFAGFSLLHSALVRGKVREVLAQKR